MDILKTVSGMMGGGGGGNAISAITQMLSEHEGGLGGLVSKFQQGGLGDVVNSWVGTGANQPISPAQVGSMFSSDQLTKLAQMLGTNVGGAQSTLSQLLPQVIDKLSPNGALPAGNDWMSEAGSLLGGLLGGQK